MSKQSSDYRENFDKQKNELDWKLQKIYNQMLKQVKLLNQQKNNIAIQSAIDSLEGKAYD